MANSKFWRTSAVIACVGLFYIGTAFRSSSNGPVPSITSAAFAGGAGTWPYRDNKYGLIYTSSADGTKLYTWETDGNPRAPKYLKTVTIAGAP
jgi:hypothetical protein